LKFPLEVIREAITEGGISVANGRTESVMEMDGI